jgi:hypothetical protein
MAIGSIKAHLGCMTNWAGVLVSENGEFAKSRFLIVRMLASFGISNLGMSCLLHSIWEHVATERKPFDSRKDAPQFFARVEFPISLVLA